MPSRYLWWTILFSRCHGATTGALRSWPDCHCAGALVSGSARIKNRRLGLLATFAAFFTFSGNLARMEPVRVLFARLLSHGTMLVSALTCQIISNVPAAILLSRFTQDACGLLVGVNVGGAGTLVASLASLITFREYTHHVPNGGKQFLFLFSGISFAFLTILLAAMSFLNG